MGETRELNQDYIPPLNQNFFQGIEYYKYFKF